jgi:hypothetical protein
MVLKLVHTIEREEMLLNSFYEAIITLIPKPNEDTRRVSFRPISFMRIGEKILKKYLETHSITH